ncbi:MAG: hypothetical protein WA688_10090 [Thermoplasmata archaeon]
MEANLLSEFEAMPTKRTPSRGILRWGAKLRRRPDAGAPALPSMATDRPMDIVTQVQTVSSLSLIALPAMRAGGRLEGVSPLSAIPILGRM